MTRLETERLILRLPEPDDVDGIAAVFTDPVAMRFFPRVYERDELAAWIVAWRAHWDEHGIGPFTAILRETGAVIGRVGFKHLTETGEMEVGWAIRRSLWRQGLATEGARACLRFGFLEHGLDPIATVTTPDNIPSQRVMEKLGFRFVREGIFYDVPQRYYRLSRTEWEATAS